MSQILVLTFIFKRSFTDLFGKQGSLGTDPNWWHHQRSFIISRGLSPVRQIWDIWFEKPGFPSNWIYVLFVFEFQTDGVFVYFGLRSYLINVILNLPNPTRGKGTKIQSRSLCKRALSLKEFENAYESCWGIKPFGFYESSSISQQQTTAMPAMLMEKLLWTKCAEISAFI